MAVGSDSTNLAAGNIPLRPPDIVMNLDRLGALYPYKYSFMRVLMRRIMNEGWKIQQCVFDIDSDGYGHAIYEATTPNGVFSFVAFSHELDREARSDRVIAEAWDMTVTLCEGRVDDQRLEFLRANVPLQEKGRLDNRCIVLSRANRSDRCFLYVVECLAKGEQPDWDTIARVGYLYRTTAVYGSGKFGMADWRKVSSQYRDFASAFCAEMFTCFLIRQFSFDLADHVGKARGGAIATPMDDAVKRYLGIGNATGLGMAPFLINHPLLINNWIEAREKALASALSSSFDEGAIKKFMALIVRVRQHLAEISTDSEEQNAKNSETRDELGLFQDWLCNNKSDIRDWSDVFDHAVRTYSLDAQELINTLLIENDDEFEAVAAPSAAGVYHIDASMKLQDLKSTIERVYDWALAYDFDTRSTRRIFWYRSEEKMEPRLGARYDKEDDDRELLMGIAYAVRQCHIDIGKATSCDRVGDFVAAHPQHRLIVRRIQKMSQTVYGDIRANLLDEDVLPIHLLRCKLSFFGVGKFDPRSRLWVRNTMFQGAPVISDIGQAFDDDWFFPIIPTAG